MQQVTISMLYKLINDVILAGLPSATDTTISIDIVVVTRSVKQDADPDSILPENKFWVEWAFVIRSSYDIKCSPMSI